MSSIDRAGTDEQRIALGDIFLSKIIPMIESSQAFRNNGEIVIWTDETEGDERAGSTDGFTAMEIVISPLAKGDAYTNAVQYTHSSDLATLELVFGVASQNGFLGAAAGAASLSDLYKAGAIPPASSTGGMAR